MTEDLGIRSLPLGPENPVSFTPPSPIGWPDELPLQSGEPLPTTILVRLSHAEIHPRCLECCPLCGPPPVTSVLKYPFSQRTTWLGENLWVL